MTALEIRDQPWTEADVADQSGRTTVVTGATSGLGVEVARMLAHRGGAVVLACRDAVRAERVAQSLAVGSRAVFVPLDLGSLASVRSAADRIREAHPRIDLLINNAGVMRPPPSVTTDGFEVHFGVNHLGHFALTGLLLEAMLPVVGSRVVTVSSVSHEHGQLDLDEVHGAQADRDGSALYARSKLAGIMFSYELQRRLAASGAFTVAVAVQPGVIATRLTRHRSLGERAVRTLVLAGIGQRSAARGALGTLRAATDSTVRGGEFYAPDGPNAYKGHPVRSRSSAASYDETAARRLWTRSEELTGVVYPV